MFYFNKEIQKSIKKGNLPKEIAKLFQHAFLSLDKTQDLNLFDIKQLTSNKENNYYRLRKGKYRAIFTIENDDFYIHSILKREEVYKKWP